jgi:tetratricopeptide (TPR) repeat protein
MAFNKDFAISRRVVQYIQSHQFQRAANQLRGRELRRSRSARCGVCATLAILIAFNIHVLGVATSSGSGTAASVEQAVALLSTGQNQRALAVLGRLPLSVQVAFYSGMAYRALGNHSAAREAFSRSISLGNNDPYVFYELIEQDRALRDKENGVADFRQFYERFPDSAWLHMLYGNAYLAKSDYAAADGEFQQALKQDPELPVAHFYLGFLAFQRGQYSAAAENLRTEIQRAPSFGEAYLFLGAALRRQGKNRESLPYLTQATARGQDSALAYSELAAAQMAEKLNSAALRTLRTAEQKFPADAAFPAQMSRVLLLLGRQEEARQQAEKAKLLNEKDRPHM